MDVEFVANISQIMTAIPVFCGAIFVGWRYVRRLRVRIEITPEDDRPTD